VCQTRRQNIGETGLSHRALYLVCIRLFWHWCICLFWHLCICLCWHVLAFVSYLAARNVWERIATPGVARAGCTWNWKTWRWSQRPCHPDLLPGILWYRCAPRTARLLLCRTPVCACVCVCVCACVCVCEREREREREREIESMSSRLTPGYTVVCVCERGNVCANTLHTSHYARWLLCRIPVVCVCTGTCVRVYVYLYIHNHICNIRVFICILMHIYTHM